MFFLCRFSRKQNIDTNPFSSHISDALTWHSALCVLLRAMFHVPRFSVKKQFVGKTNKSICKVKRLSVLENYGKKGSGIRPRMREAGSDHDVGQRTKQFAKDKYYDRARILSILQNLLRSKSNAQTRCLCQLVYQNVSSLVSPILLETFLCFCFLCHTFLKLHGARC